MPVVPPLKFDAYPLYDELNQYLHTLEEAVPHLVRLYTIGASPAGRPLLVAEITNKGTGPAEQKASVWIDGNSRGCDVASSVACMAILQRLASEHGRDEAITDILDRFAFYIMPRVCPDEAEDYLLTGSGKGEICAGITVGDANGDGRVLQMRQPHPLGEWKLSQEDPRLMIPRSPDDREGEFYHLYREGVCAAENTGTGAVCRTELQARLDFLRSIKTVSVALSLGADADGILLSGLGEKPDTDADLWRLVGRRLASVAEVPCSEKEACCDEWADMLYREQGMLAISAQLWNFARLAGADTEHPFAPEAQLKALRWLEKELEGAGFAAWEGFSHPQLGSVEIGGWDLMHTWFNPPAGPILEAFCQVHVAMALSFAELLPCLKLSGFREEIVGWSEDQENDGEDLIPLRRISLELSNTGGLPTWITERAKALLPLPEAAVELAEGSVLLAGDMVSRTARLAGLLSAHIGSEGNSVLCGASAERRYCKLSWLVCGEGAIKVVVSQPRVSSAVFGDAKKTAKTAPVYQSASERAAAEKPPAPAVVRQMAPGASQQSESAESAKASSLASQPSAKPVRTFGHTGPTRGELGANSSAAQARNVSLLRGMTAAAEREEGGSSRASEPVPVSLISASVSSTSIVRPVSLINKQASADADDAAPAPEPHVPSSADARGAMGGYRPMRPAYRPAQGSAAKAAPSGGSYPSGEYRTVPDASGQRPIIRGDSPLRKEQPSVSGRVFGQGSSKSGPAAAGTPAAPQAPPRATFGRPVGQTDLERRNAERERMAVETMSFEGHEIKPHSLLGSKKKAEPEEEAVPEPPPPPVTGPVTAQLLRRPKDTE
ncbi:hypothetical protein IJT17_08450 [bacterium]|nr:hypothetical protein [bacterium]